MSLFRWFKFHFGILSERPLKSKLQLGPFILFQNLGRRCFKNISVRQQSSRPWNEICSCSVCKKKNSCSSATNERAVLFGQRFIIEFETQQQHWNTGQIRNLFSRSVRSHFPPNVGCPWQTGQTTFKLKENHSNRISANLIKVPSKKWEKIFLKTKENNGNGQSHSF